MCLKELVTICEQVSSRFVNGQNSKGVGNTSNGNINEMSRTRSEIQIRTPKDRVFMDLPHGHKVPAETKGQVSSLVDREHILSIARSK